MAKKFIDGKSSLRMIDKIVLSDFYDYIRILDGEGYPKHLLSLVNLE